MTKKRYTKLMRAYWTKLYMENKDKGIQIAKSYRALRNCKIVNNANPIYSYSRYQYIYNICTKN